MKIYTENTKIIEFRLEAIRSKVYITDRTLDQINTFKYLGFNISYN